eukprot:TRINITY_DN14407_c0_g1_i1.p1 TRINITY_DN14407_c0_g1~~TRINITY_DN14407_c0_g1_i1.p1  ORF type:complete len:610 (+),score=188.05 TRINITY_DN14407_c0_g1_i1:78-1907(+)
MAMVAPLGGGYGGSCSSASRGNASEAAAAEDKYYQIRKMTPEVLAQICKERQMWSQPHLNTQLFLNYKGFDAIEGMEAFTKVRVLYLGNNNIGKIEGLDRMTDLRALHLEGNRISRIENLTNNLELRNINLEANAIQEVSGLAHLSKLEQLSLANNAISSIQALAELKEVPQLSNVDISSNQVEDVEGVTEFWSEFTSLKVLRFHGNPCVRHVTHYRKRLINSLPNLSYLDERPIFPVERRSCAAWAEGGQEAMHKARQDYHREQKSHTAIDPDRALWLTRQRKAAIERIEKAERERAAEAAQAGGQEEPISSGDLEALKKYEESWQRKVNLHGAESLRQQVADVERGGPSKSLDSTNPWMESIAEAAKKANASAAGDDESRALPSREEDADGSEGTADGRAKAAAAIRAAQQRAEKARASPTWAGAAKNGHDFRPAARQAPPAAGDATRASLEVQRGRPGADAFRVRTSLPSRDGAGEADQDAGQMVREFQDRQFSVLGDDSDVWAATAAGSSFRGKNDGGNAAAAGAGFSSPGHPRSSQSEEIIPDIWARNTEARMKEEAEAMAKNFEHGRDRQPPSDAAASETVVPAAAISTPAAPVMSSDLMGLD